MHATNLLSTYLIGSSNSNASGHDWSCVGHHHGKWWSTTSPSTQRSVHQGPHRCQSTRIPVRLRGIRQCGQLKRATPMTRIYPEQSSWDPRKQVGVWSTNQELANPHNRIPFTPLLFRNYSMWFPRMHHYHCIIFINATVIAMLSSLDEV